MEPNSLRQDIVWITNVKAICIILVYLSHVSIFYGSNIGIVRNLIEPFYVHAFFIASGYLLFWKQLSSHSLDEKPYEYIMRGKGAKLLCNIFFRIVLPSIVFSFIFYFPKMLLGGAE